MGKMAAQGSVTMQCRQKRFDFYYYILYCFNWSLVVHVINSCGSIFWTSNISKWRRITSLIDSLRRSEKNHHLVESKGKDFLFLFDLVAHTCGQPATLRVLSFTAPAFADLCQPEVDKMTMTETSITITWNRAPLQSLRGIKQLELQRYVVTIFPYTSNSKQDVKAQDEHMADFQDLVGGKKEYVIYVSAIIEDAKMKGEKRVTYLPPYPPMKLMTSNLEPGVVRVTWARPKGEFDKYILKVTNLAKRKSSLTIAFSPRSTGASFKHIRRAREPDEVWLGAEELEHTVKNLKPGERYRLELRSMTGTQTCLEDKVPSTVLVTIPLPPRNLEIATSSDEVKISWVPPEGQGHSFLKGYKVILRDPSGKLVKELMQSEHSRVVALTNLLSASEYVVALATVCREEEESGREGDTDFLESSSDFVEARAVTLPLPPHNLKLETTTHNSLKVKWDQSTSTPNNAKVSYRIGIQASNLEVRGQMGEDMKEVETNIFTFSHLPDILGSGEQYKITVETVAQLSGQNYYSSTLAETFTTRPLPPEKLVIEDATKQLFRWQRSPSPSVSSYKLKIKRDDEKATDYIIQSTGDESGSVSFAIPTELEPGGEYKINIYSQVLVEDGRELESEPLHHRLLTFVEENNKTHEDNQEYAEDEFDAKETIKKRIVIKLLPTEKNINRRKTQKLFENSQAVAAGQIEDMATTAMKVMIERQLSHVVENNPNLLKLISVSPSTHTSGPTQHVA